MGQQNLTQDQEESVVFFQTPVLVYGELMTLMGVRDETGRTSFACGSVSEEVGVRIALSVWGNHGTKIRQYDC